MHLPALDAGLPAPDLEAYSPEQVRFAVAAWPMRAAEELRSALIFRALARAAREGGLSTAWILRFASAARDEIRHTRLCAAVGARLGAPPPRHDCTAVRGRLGSLPDPIDRAGALLLVEVAIGETISTQLFKAGRSIAAEPLTRAALGSILRDEVRHAHLGWTGCAAWLPLLPAKPRRDLELEVRRSLGAFEQQIAVPAMRRLDAGEHFDPMHAALGVLPPTVRVDAFYAAVEGQVLPRLTRLGFDGAQLWSQRYLDRNEDRKS